VLTLRVVLHATLAAQLTSLLASQLHTLFPAQHFHQQARCVQLARAPPASGRPAARKCRLANWGALGSWPDVQRGRAGGRGAPAGRGSLGLGAASGERRGVCAAFQWQSSRQTGPNFSLT